MSEYSLGHLFDIVALELKYAPELKEFSFGQRFVETNGIYPTYYMYFDSNQKHAICARFSNDYHYFLDSKLNENTVVEKALNAEYFAMLNDLSEGRVNVVHFRFINRTDFSHRIPLGMWCIFFILIRFPFPLFARFSAFGLRYLLSFDVVSCII